MSARKAAHVGSLEFDPWVKGGGTQSSRGSAGKATRVQTETPEERQAAQASRDVS